jgi:hypothetical protein
LSDGTAIPVHLVPAGICAAIPSDRDGFDLLFIGARHFPVAFERNEERALAAACGQREHFSARLLYRAPSGT